ncbi:MAG: DUF5053 domain-containing protein [Bacteroidaceae bacterium]|nr:DUF5053 domain-containing protein [Bacteroidaceae bacterium]
MNEIEILLSEYKSLMGKTDSASETRKAEIMEWIRQNDSPEVQSKLDAFLLEGLGEEQREIQALKVQFSDDYSLLPLSYIAKVYFGKSSSWLYQRLNGYEIRGHRYTLNAQQKQTFNQACQDVARRIGSVYLS